MRTAFLFVAVPLGIVLAAEAPRAGDTGTRAQSEEPAPQVEQSSKDDAWRRIYAREAAAWEVVSRSEPPEALNLVNRPVMHWASVDDFNGDVFVWTRNGRVELIGTIFSYARGANPPSRHVRPEFHSLSGQPLQLRHPRWGAVTIDAGIKLKELPGATRPSPQPPRRQAQMRQLARQFSSHMDHHGERWELRLLPQPLYQDGIEADAPAGEDQPVAVALFAFVGFATDPELLLLIQARRTDEGHLQWFYQPMRFSNRSLWLRFNEREIWESLRGVQTAAEDPDEASYRLLPSRLLSPDATGPDP